MEGRNGRMERGSKQTNKQLGKLGRETERKGGLGSGQNGGGRSMREGERESDDLVFFLSGEEQTRTIAWPPSCHVSVKSQMAEIWQVHLLLQARPLLLVPVFLDWLHCLLD